jgi:hypothetical protein
MQKTKSTHQPKPRGPLAGLLAAALSGCVIPMGDDTAAKPPKAGSSFAGGGIGADGGAAGGGGADGGASVGAGGSTWGEDAAPGADASAAAAAPICDEPAPWGTPGRHLIVGAGTEVGCTADAVRAAVSQGAFVTFNCGAEPVTIAVTSEIRVSKDSVLDGEGLVTFDGQGSTRIFSVDSGHSLSVRRLRMVNGKAPASTDADGIGGAIAGQWKSKVEVRESVFEGNQAGRGGGAVAVWTASSLTIVRSRFERNRSWYGGAVYSLLSPLSITNSVFEGNQTLDDGEGGAIGTDGASESPDDGNGGEVLLCGTRLVNNTSRGAGGAAFMWVYPPDAITIDRSTIQGNTVHKNAGGLAMGGGLRASNGLVTIRASSFLSNTGESHGGALSLDCAPTCTIANSTFDGNRAGPAEGGAGYGGAIFGNKYTARNVTFARNFAGGHGGLAFGGNDFELRDAVLVDNQSGNPWGQAQGCADTGRGVNVIQWVAANGGAGSGGCISSVMAVDPKLDATPGDHGGPTATLLLGAGSAALGAGAECEAVDQRGVARDAARCDLGAVEMP